MRNTPYVVWRLRVGLYTTGLHSSTELITLEGLRLILPYAVFHFNASVHIIKLIIAIL